MQSRRNFLFVEELLDHDLYGGAAAGVELIGDGDLDNHASTDVDRTENCFISLSNDGPAARSDPIEVVDFTNFRVEGVDDNVRGCVSDDEIGCCSNISNLRGVIVQEPARQR